MHLPLRCFALLMAVLFAAGCQKKSDTQAAGSPPAPAAAPAKPRNATVDLVAENQRSKNFLAVQKHLELGGTLYGYVDVEGDALKLTNTVKTLATELARVQPNAAMLAQQDLDAIATMLGFTDIKALGVSSVPEGDGFFRNRVFIHAPGERHGFMAALGGKPGPFKHLALAPADAAFYAETELDMAVVYKTIKDVVAKVAGEPASNQLEAGLRKAGEAIALSFVDLFYGLKGHSAIVVRIDEAAPPLRTPGPKSVALPAFSFLVVVDGVGQVVAPSLDKSPAFRRSNLGNVSVYELAQRLPMQGVEPAIVIDGGQLYVTSSIQFYRDCRSRTTGLADAPDFKKAMERFGNEGNGLSYVSPKLFEQLRSIERLNPELPAESKPIIALFLNKLPQIDRPIVAVRTNLDDGILMRMHMNRSLKQDIVGIAAYNPLTVGLMAAMAIPAFQKVRTASQEKAVLNNLRQLAAAADQHYLEMGTTSATYDQLVGPDKYVKQIVPVAGENYRTIRFRQGQPLRVRLANGKLIEYSP